MNQQRLYPEFPDWPCLCFYPMSKTRQPDQNWYLLPFEERSELMSQHGRSGMKFAGRVTQLITASTGLDDWEWGVTLWARNPSYLKDIVYTAHDPNRTRSLRDVDVPEMWIPGRLVIRGLLELRHQARRHRGPDLRQ